MNSQHTPYVKPYYTLEETLKRLKEAGADLDTIDDVLMIAREDMGEKRLEIKLLCDEHVILVKPCQTKIIKLKLPSDFDRQFWLDNYLSPKDIEDFIYEIEFSNWLVTEQIYFSEHIGSNKNTESDFLIDAYLPNESNLLVTPVSLDVAYDGSHVLAKNSSWLRNPKHQQTQREYLAAIWTNGTLYYVASERKTNPILESYKLVENNNIYSLAKYEKEGESRERNWHSLECETIQKLIKSKNYVVTREALLNFKEGITGASKSKQLPNKSPEEKIDSKRIASLQSFINQMVVLAKQRNVNFDPLDMRCTKDMLLEELKKWEKDRTPAKKDRVWEVNDFPKKTWASKERKQICLTLDHGGNPNINYFKNLK